MERRNFLHSSAAGLAGGLLGMLTEQKTIDAAEAAEMLKLPPTVELPVTVEVHQIQQMMENNQWVGLAAQQDLDQRLCALEQQVKELTASLAVLTDECQECDQAEEGRNDWVMTSRGSMEPVGYDARDEETEFQRALRKMFAEWQKEGGHGTQPLKTYPGSRNHLRVSCKTWAMLAKQPLLGERKWNSMPQWDEYSLANHGQHYIGIWLNEQNQIQYLAKIFCHMPTHTSYSPLSQTTVLGDRLSIELKTGKLCQEMLDTPHLRIARRWGTRSVFHFGVFNSEKLVGPQLLVDTVIRKEAVLFGGHRLNS